MWSRSETMLRLIRSLKVSLMAVSGAIFRTFVPLPRKNALSVPAHRACRSAEHFYRPSLRSLAMG